MTCRLLWLLAIFCACATYRADVSADGNAAVSAREPDGVYLVAWRGDAKVETWRNEVPVISWHPPTPEGSAVFLRSGFRWRQASEAEMASFRADLDALRARVGLGPLP